jgi:predicted DNA-binding transcriptional regulator AlpA
MELIKTKEAAKILGLSEKTVHNRRAGTDKLKRVYLGSSVRLVKEEVIGFRQAALAAAERRAA